MATFKSNFDPLTFGATPYTDDTTFDPLSSGATPTDNQQRIARARQEAAVAEGEANKSLTRRFLTTVPQEASRYALETPAKFATSALVSPFDIYRGLRGQKPIDVNLPFIGGTYQSEAQNRMETGAPLFQAAPFLGKSTPLGEGTRAAIEIPLAGWATGGLAKGLIGDVALTGPEAGKVTKGLIPRGYEAGRGFFQQRADKRALEEAVDLTRPVLSKKEEIAAKASGRGFTTKIKGEVGITPANKDIEVAGAAKDFVSKKNNAFENIQSLKQGISDSSEYLRGELEKSDAIWNKNELQSYLRDVKMPISMKSDKTLQTTAENINGAVLDIANGQSKKTVGILNLRQNFDDLVDREFPNLYDKAMTPTRIYIQRMREALNQFAEDKIPDGILPNGDTVKDTLRFQHLLITAKENIAEKAPKIGSTSISRFFKSHPNIKTGLKYAGLGGLAGEGYNLTR